MFSNNEATLTLYKNSLRGVCKDYVIRFNEEQVSIEKIISISSDIVKQLIDSLQKEDKTFKGRLIACVSYLRIGNEEEVMYYHPSYRNEVIEDANEFYMTHMLKIAQRMDDFNKNGSKLLIKNISEIHLHISCQN